MFAVLCMKREFSNDGLILAAYRLSTTFCKWSSK